MKTRKPHPLAMLKKCDIDTFAKDVQSRDSKTFHKFESKILNNILYIQIFFEKLKKAHAEKKLTAKDIMDFFLRPNMYGYNLMQNIIIQNKAGIKSHDLYWVFLDALQRNLLGNVLTNTNLCYLLLQPNKGRLSSYKLILTYPHLSNDRRMYMFNIMSTIIYKLLTEKELISNVLQTMFAILSSFSSLPEKVNKLKTGFIRNYFNILRKADDEYILQIKALIIKNELILSSKDSLKAMYNEFLSRCDAIQLPIQVKDACEENVEYKNDNSSIAIHQKFYNYLINQIACISYGDSYFAYPLDQSMDLTLNEKDAKDAKETVSIIGLSKYTDSAYLLFAQNEMREDSIKEMKLTADLSSTRYTP
jgi:hypothetical protein